MIKVLVPLPFELWGGLHQMTVSVYKGLLKKNIILIPLIPKNCKDIKNRFKHNKISCLSSNLTRPRKSYNIFLNLIFFILIFRDIFLIGKIVKKNQIKIIHISGIQNFHYFLIAKMYNCKVVCQIHSDALPYFFRCILSPIVIFFSDFIMYNGRYIQDKFFLIKKNFSKKSQTLFYPGINTRNFNFKKKQKIKAKKILNIPRSNIVIGTIGNQVYAKAHERIVNISNKFKNYSKVNFLILGSPVASNKKYYQKKVILHANNLGLFKNKKLQIINAHNKVSKYLPAIDIFLLTSRFEGFPVALLEAMSCKLPIVTTNVGSINEIIKNNKNGFIDQKDNFNINFFFASLLKLIKNINLKKKFSIYNKNLIKKKFSIDNIVYKHELAYKACINKV